MAELPESWILNDAFESVVLKPLRQDQQTLELLQNETDFDSALRQKLNRGSAPCNTEQMALWYCYTYMLMHLDAYQTVIKERSDFFDELLLDSNNELLMIDFGCGPLTAPIAMAEYMRQIPCGIILGYIGIDHMETMLQIASEFASHIFRPYWEPILELSWSSIKLTNLVKPKKIVFNFSYFFGQTLTQIEVKECAQLVIDVLLKYKIDDVHLIYLNIDDYGYRQNYRYFKELMNLPIEPINPISYRYRRFRNLKFSGYGTSGLTLYYEILKLDWRSHEKL